MSQPSGPARPEHRWLQHPPPAWADATYFFTLCSHPRRQNRLCVPDVASQLFAAVRRNQEQHRWHVSLLLLMPDHLHTLLSCADGEDIIRLVRRWKQNTARDAGIVWRQHIYGRRLRREENLEEEAQFIRMNPVRKGLVATPEAWPYYWTPEL